MKSDAPENPIICHITHIVNLPEILRVGGLLCDKKAQQSGVCQQGIAHSHIKARRAKRIVTTQSNGYLCDYAPFYFWHHSPMLYAIHTGYIAGYEGRQNDVVYLVSDVNRVQKAGLPFCFSDGHAEVALSHFYENLSDLSRLDWATIKAKQWSDTDEDGDRKRRKQAEFLVHDFLPWQCISQIGVYDEGVAEQIRAASKDMSVPVAVRRNWYY